MIDLLRLEVVRMLVSLLIPFVANSRTHSPEQVTQIAKSIESFGFVNPILVGPDNVIIAGAGRLAAPCPQFSTVLMRQT
jgi:hypothetical protein